MTEPNTTQTAENPESAAPAEAEKESASNFDGPRERPAQTEEQLEHAADVTESMHDVIDPELGINVVDLGLVYDIWMEEDDGEEIAVVNMTLTSPACPLTEVIEDQAHAAVVGSGMADKMELNWVWMPPWGAHMITDDGREQLRALGFAV